MSFVYPCDACWRGDHSRHRSTDEVRSVWQGPVFLGGKTCDCDGNCAERAAEAAARFREIFGGPAVSR